MKLQKFSSISLDTLKGSLIINENGAEFYIHDFFVELDNLTEINVSIKDVEDGGITGLSYSSIKNWTIQLQGGLND